MHLDRQRDRRDDLHRGRVEERVIEGHRAHIVERRDVPRVRARSCRR